MTSNLPLIRLSAINPFLVELHRRDINVVALLQDLSLPTQIPASPDLFVAPIPSTRWLSAPRNWRAIPSWDTPSAQRSI